jgi:hypothetical protein
MSEAPLIDDYQIARRAFSRSRDDMIDRLEDDWEVYSRFAESDFREKFNILLNELSTHIANKLVWTQWSDKLINLWWEMHVGTYLVRTGFDLKTIDEKSLSEKSPNLDHLIITPEGKRVWVECTQAARGPISTELPGFDIEGCGDLPLKEMMLRVTNSLSQKASTKNPKAQINRFKTAYPKFENDCYIVALGTGNLPSDEGDRFSPSVAFNAVFGIGDPTWTINKNGSNCSFQGVETKDKVLKKNDCPINTTGFLDESYSTIAGLFVSQATLFHDAKLCGIANPTAVTSLPDQFHQKIPTWSFDVDRQTILRPSQDC